MAKAKGTVTRIGDGKFSKYIMLDTRDGFYFNTKYNPKVGVGDLVGIDFTPKGDTRGNISKVTLLEDNGGPKGVQESAKSGGGGRGRDQGPSIVWQHSQEMAIRIVSLLVSSESIKLPAVAKREGFLSTLVDDYTQKYSAEATDAKLGGPVEDTEPEVKKSGQDESTNEWSDAEDKDEWARDDEWKD